MRAELVTGSSWNWDRRCALEPGQVSPVMTFDPSMNARYTQLDLKANLAFEMNPGDL